VSATCLARGTIFSTLFFSRLPFANHRAPLSRTGASCRLWLPLSLFHRGEIPDANGTHGYLAFGNSGHLGKVRSRVARRTRAPSLAIGIHLTAFCTPFANCLGADVTLRRGTILNSRDRCVRKCNEFYPRIIPLSSIKYQRMTRRTNITDVRMHYREKHHYPLIASIVIVEFNLAGDRARKRLCEAITVKFTFPSASRDRSMRSRYSVMTRRDSISKLLSARRNAVLSFSAIRSPNASTTTAETSPAVVLLHRGPVRVHCVHSVRVMNRNEAHSKARRTVKRVHSAGGRRSPRGCPLPPSASTTSRRPHLSLAARSYRTAVTITVNHP